MIGRVRSKVGLEGTATFDAGLGREVVRAVGVKSFL